jgi:hypothetical protein
LLHAEGKIRHELQKCVTGRESLVVNAHHWQLSLQRLPPFPTESCFLQAVSLLEMHSSDIY